MTNNRPILTSRMGRSSLATNSCRFPDEVRHQTAFAMLRGYFSKCKFTRRPKLLGCKIERVLGVTTALIFVRPCIESVLYRA
jgi:hypothetical protein